MATPTQDGQPPCLCGQPAPCPDCRTYQPPLQATVTDDGCLEITLNHHRPGTCGPWAWQRRIDTNGTTTVKTGI